MAKGRSGCVYAYLSQRLEDEITFWEMLRKNTRRCGRERPRPARLFERTVPIPSAATLLVTCQGQVRCTLTDVIHRGLATHLSLLLPLLDPPCVQPYATLTANSSSQIIRSFPHSTNQVWTFWIVRSDSLAVKSGDCSIEASLGVVVHERAIRSSDKKDRRHAGVLFCRFP